MVHSPLIRKNYQFKNHKIHIFLPCSQKWLIIIIQVLNLMFKLFFCIWTKFFEFCVGKLWCYWPLASHHIRYVFQLCPNNTVNSSESSISRDNTSRERWRVCSGVRRSSVGILKSAQILKCCWPWAFSQLVA